MPAPLTTTLLSQPDQLKASLEAHNASFDQLLKHIPAKYYIRADSDDEDDKPIPLEKMTKAQRKAALKAKKDEAVRAAKNEAKREARLAAYDPDEPKTIAEIQAAKLSAAAKGKKRAADASSDGEGAWEDDEDEDSPNETDFADSDDEDVAEGDFLELGEAGVLRNKAAQAGPAPTITELREKLQKRIADIQAAKKGTAGKAGAKKGKKAAESDDEDVEEGEGEVKSKDDLLEERRRRAALRDNRRKKLAEKKKLEKSDGAKKRATEPSNGRKGGGKVNAGQQDEDRPRKKVRADSPSYDDSAALVPFDGSAAVSASASDSDPNSIAFSNLDFTSNSQLAAEAGLTPLQLKKMQKASGSLKKNRHALPKDANQALEILAKRKARMEELEPEKREKAEEKERWEKVGLKAEGLKVRDDETRLKKMAKRQEREKRKSAKAWSDRKATVEKTVSDRVAKRNANLAARSKDKKDKKLGIKKKSGGKTSSTSSSKTRSKGRPGFEGGRKKK